MGVCETSVYTGARDVSPLPFDSYTGRVPPSSSLRRVWTRLDWGVVRPVNLTWTPVYHCDGRGGWGVCVLGGIHDRINSRVPSTKGERDSGLKNLSMLITLGCETKQYGNQEGNSWGEDESCRTRLPKGLSSRASELPQTRKISWTLVERKDTRLKFTLFTSSRVGLTEINDDFRLSPFRPIRVVGTFYLVIGLRPKVGNVGLSWPDVDSGIGWSRL